VLKGVLRKLDCPDRWLPSVHPPCFCPSAISAGQNPDSFMKLCDQLQFVVPVENVRAGRANKSAENSRSWTTPTNDDSNRKGEQMSEFVPRKLLLLQGEVSALRSAAVEMAALSLGRFLLWKKKKKGKRNTNCWWFWRFGCATAFDESQRKSRCLRLSVVKQKISLCPTESLGEISNLSWWFSNAPNWLSPICCQLCIPVSLFASEWNFECCWGLRAFILLYSWQGSVQNRRNQWIAFNIITFPMVYAPEEMDWTLWKSKKKKKKKLIPLNRPGGDLKEDFHSSTKRITIYFWMSRISRYRNVQQNVDFPEREVKKKYQSVPSLIDWVSWASVREFSPPTVILPLTLRRCSICLGFIPSVALFELSILPHSNLTHFSGGIPSLVDVCLTNIYSRFQIEITSWMTTWPRATLSSGIIFPNKTG
jgi:hypothetical protein